MCNFQVIIIIIFIYNYSFLSSDLNHLFNLQLQGVIIQSVTAQLNKSEIARWGHCILSLPEACFKFARRAFINQLASASNLVRWGRGLSNLCILCNAIQTNKHILSNCSSALARYTVRHDSLLSIIVDYLNTAIKDATLYSDLKGAKSVSHCFKSLRPDIVIVSASAKRVVSIELTVYHETNFESARLRKMLTSNLICVTFILATI